MRELNLVSKDQREENLDYLRLFHVLCQQVHHFI